MNDLRNSFGPSNYLEIFSFASTYTQGRLYNYDAISNAPSEIKAFSITRQIRDIDEDRIRSYYETHVLNKSKQESKDLFTCLSSVSLDAISKPTLFEESPSTSKKVSFYNTFYGAATATKEEKPYLEYEVKGDCGFRLDLSKLHGKVVGDAWFGGCAWSADERFVAYVAERKVETSHSYFSEINRENESISSKKFEYVEDWGELYEGVSSTQLFVLDTEKRIVLPISGFDLNRWTVGQPALATVINKETCAKSFYLAFTAWNNLPRRLGMIHCYQRMSSIFLVDLTKYLLDLVEITSSDFKQISARIKISRSPRFSPDGLSLVFLGNAKGFKTHNGCSELFKFAVCHANESDLADKVVTIIPEIRNGFSGHMDQISSPFPGLFLDQLSRQPFIHDNATIALTSTWGSCEALLLIDTQEIDPSVERINFIPSDDSSGSRYNLLRNRFTIFQPIPSRMEGTSSDTSSDTSGISSGVESIHRIEGCVPLQDASSYGLMDVRGDTLLVTVSQPNAPHRVAWVNLPEGVASVMDVANQSSPIKFFDASQKVSVQSDSTAAAVSLKRNLFKQLDWKIFRHYPSPTTPSTHSDAIPFESILLYPKTSTIESSSASPLIVVPHGGPHSVSSTAFFPSYAFLSLQLNAAILHVNYRGSTGMGQDSIESLPGNIGRNDVDDVMTAVNFAKSYAKSNGTELSIDDDRICVVGGSHGGFLASHLIGQHPSVFRAACLRNPVINIPAMVSTTDIPDWCFIEALGLSIDAYDFDDNRVRVITNDDLINMRQCSPIRYIDQMQSPTLICIGRKDKRVPHYQGLELYHALKSRGVTTRMMSFPDDVHSLSRPASEVEHWVAIAEWISKFCVMKET